MENTGLSSVDFRKIQDVFRSFQAVEKVWIYGSRAKGNFKPYSDIDLTLEGNNLDLNLKFQIESALDELYLPYNFDLSIKSQIENIELLDHIERIGKLFFEK